jgi:hypothetical protein
LSIDLVRQSDSLRFTVFVWGEVLRFARLYGWEPAGTLPPEECDAEERARWDGNYVLNGGQSVRPTDAWAMAEALTRGLPDLPDEYAARDKTVVGETGGQPTILVPVGAPLSPIEALSGPNKDAVRELVAFCRQGGFDIE